MAKNYASIDLFITLKLITVKDKLKALTNNVMRFISEVFQIFKLTIAITNED